MELNLSDSELIVMRVIWNLENPSAETIIEKLKTKNSWAPSTIKTFLARLVKKGILGTTKESHYFVYHPLKAEEEVMEQMTSEFLNKVCSSKRKFVLERIIDSSDFTEEDIDELQNKFLNKVTVERVKCNCIENLKVCSCNNCIILENEIY